MFILNKKLWAVLVVFLAIFLVSMAHYVFKNNEMPPNLSQNPDDLGVTARESQIDKSSPFLGKPRNNIPKYIGRPLNEVVFGKGFSASDVAIENKKGDLKVLASVLNANPVGSLAGVDDWIAVGVIKKFFNDFEGARDAWEYAGVLYPDSALSFANLGNLYAFYLHDNVKAELNFKRAITNDPYQPGYYLSFADFYKNVYTAKKTEAVKVLLAGISRIKDVNLVLTLASYYRDEGDKSDALKYYQEVLKISPNQAGISEEIDRLK